MCAFARVSVFMHELGKGRAFAQGSLVRTDSYAWAWKGTRVSTRLSVHVCGRACVRICMSVRVCAYVCVRVCCVHTIMGLYLQAPRLMHAPMCFVGCVSSRGFCSATWLGALVEALLEVQGAWQNGCAAHGALGAPG